MFGVGLISGFMGLGKGWVITVRGYCWLEMVD
jgi:hypothetical protein